MMIIKENNHFNILHETRLSWKLYSADSNSFIRHLYNSILKREPEPGAIESMNIKEDRLATAAKIKYIFDYISTPEAFNHHKENYYYKVKMLFDALGYNTSSDYATKTFITVFSDENSLSEKSEELIHIISGNTDQSYYAFESNYGFDSEQVAIDIASLTKAVLSLSSRCDQLDENLRGLIWNIADLKSKLNPQDISVDHHLAEISEMMTVLLNRSVGASK